MNDSKEISKAEKLNLIKDGLIDPQNVTPKDVAELIYDQRERLKELACINQTTQILKENKPIEESLQQITHILPPAWQYPEFACGRIVYGENSFKSPKFIETKWVQSQIFETLDSKKGIIEVFYTKDFPLIDEGPFLKEERHLINNLASLITGYLNSLIARDIISRKPYEIQERSVEIPKVSTSRNLLQQFLNKNNYNRDIYHDLMPFKVKEILLVANLYDAYSIEKEGRFSEHVLGEYQQLNLSSVPRITGVSSEEELFDQLGQKHFDLIIFMVGVDKSTPINLSKKIKKDLPYIPVFLLLNNNSEMAFYTEKKHEVWAIDKFFVWNGDSTVFFAMIKHLEDKINVDNDTRMGLVRIILLVEDTPQYYSRYLPMLYNIVLQQTKRIIDDVSTDELYKVLRMRARPKILLATNYEQAIEIFDKYRDYLLCLITDVKFSRNNILDENAGISLVKHIRAYSKDLPTIIQSSEQGISEMAYQLKATFIDKNSDSLMQDFKSFITHYLGFGNFIYRDKQGRQIAIAKTLKEFENLLRTIPDESLIYHAKKDHFSLWLMARGEIQVAKIINPAKISDFNTSQELRDYLIEVIAQFRNEQKKGKIVPFEEPHILDESNIVSLSGGSLGGKGRGVAFINTLIYNYDFTKYIPNINICAPRTFIIGTDEYEFFIERNKLLPAVLNESDTEVINKLFLEAKLTSGLILKLKKILSLIEKPLAIRSSGLFEDSMMQPFAGIFETYLLPNNHAEFNVRLEQCSNAIKLVYASVFAKTARDYIEAINYKIEEEKMAIVIQEVVGNQYNDVFYPHISGVAQSYNYYPIAHMKPEEGFAVIALGLGKQVVDGEKAYRFSPKYPGSEINSPKDLFKNSQSEFYAVDLAKKTFDLLEGDTAGLKKLYIDEAEFHGNLKHLASVYDAESQSIFPGISKPGPRILNFANILKYNYIPLSKTIEVVLDVVKEAMGTPVEIEFAVDLNKDKENKASFYILQIKPLIGSAMDYKIDMDEIADSSILLFTNKCMGNGLIDSIMDVVYVDTTKFDKSKTFEMACEIEKINEKFAKENKKYLLIGPGRWGTRDKYIGIPVTWPQISQAKVIVETSLEDFPLEASSGSHFFHNVTSMNVGYFSVHHEIRDHKLDYQILKKQKLIHETTYFKHVRFKKPLKIKMDGTKRIAVITF